MTTIKNKSSLKKRTCLSDKYKDFYQERHKPVSLQYIEQLAHDLLDWSEKPTSLNMSEFLRRYPWRRTQFYHWKDLHPYLEEAWQIARVQLTDNREKWVMSDPRQFPIYARNQAKYDEEYREMVTWRESVRAKTTEQGDTIVKVVIPDFEKHPNVPERERKNQYELESGHSD